MLKGSILLLALMAFGCGQSESSGLVTQTSQASHPPAAAVGSRDDTAEPAVSRASTRDLSADEDLGGHTLSRHVGKTDGELRARLRREPQISAASTYTDRPTAERAVGAALAEKSRAFEAWRARSGSRPNFVLRYTATGTIGRSLARGRPESVPCDHAVVVLRWNERERLFYVLTSYPEENR